MMHIIIIYTYNNNCIMERYYCILSDNIYQPSRCQEVIEELRKCCIKHSYHSTVCDGINTSKQYEHNTIDYVSPTFVCTSFRYIIY